MADILAAKVVESSPATAQSEAPTREEHPERWLLQSTSLRALGGLPYDGESCCTMFWEKAGLRRAAASPPPSTRRLRDPERTTEAMVDSSGVLSTAYYGGL